MEIHHKDGNRLNDNDDNLSILCPNCHSFTPNYSRNIKKNKVSEEELLEALKNNTSIYKALLSLHMSTAGANYTRAREIIIKYKLEHLYQHPKENYCIDCGKPISSNATRCQSCNGKNNRNEKTTSDKPDALELQKILYENKGNFTKVGELFGVTDSAIRKWCKSYNLPYHSPDYKEKKEPNYEHSKPKKVAMLDKNTNEIIKTFDSLTEASEYINNKAGRSHIADAAKGKRLTAYGYKWELI